MKANKCKKCGYDLSTTEAYKIIDGYKYPANGDVQYYNRYKLILCDKCVDELDGHPWR